MYQQKCFFFFQKTLNILVFLGSPEKSWLSLPFFKIKNKKKKKKKNEICFLFQIFLVQNISRSFPSQKNKTFSFQNNKFFFIKKKKRRFQREIIFNIVHAFLFKTFPQDCIFRNLCLQFNSIEPTGTNQVYIVSLFFGTNISPLSSFLNNKNEKMWWMTTLCYPSNPLLLSLHCNCVQYSHAIYVVNKNSHAIYYFQLRGKSPSHAIYIYLICFDCKYSLT